jgi:hypothetical protein
MTDDLLTRAEKARAEGLSLVAQSEALRKLRMLEREFRAITRRLSETMHLKERPDTAESVKRILAQAEALLLSPPPLKMTTFNN